MEETAGTIDNAITATQDVIKRHRTANAQILAGVLFTLVGFFSYFIFIYSDSRFAYKAKIDELTHRYQAARSYVDTLYKVLPDSLRVKRFTYTTVLDDSVSKEPEKNSEGSSLINYGIYLFGIVIISILTALYRLHLKEISKAEQNLTAFYRIRIAANNVKNEGFGTEVRLALTQNAFYHGTESGSSILGSNKKVESPIPGHPSSDLLTAVLNKILDNVEVKPKS